MAKSAILKTLPAISKKPLSSSPTGRKAIILSASYAIKLPLLSSPNPKTSIRSPPSLTNYSTSWKRLIEFRTMKSLERKQEFKNRVSHWAAKLEVNIVWLGLRPMRNKWASCSTKGHLNFNIELLDLDPELWDYVIVHELLHFFVPNHGKLWKSLMRVHLGEYEKAKETLQAMPL